MQLTADNPARAIRDQTIAQQRIQGMTYREIAEANNVCIHTVGRVLNDTEIKNIVETGTRELVSMVPLAIDNYHTFLTTKDHPEHYKASKDCLQATGILASHAASTTINNIVYQDNRTQISSNIADLIAYQTDQQAVEEADFEVIE